MSLIRLLLLAALLAPALAAQISEKEAVERLDDAIDDAEDVFDDVAKQAVKDVAAAVKVAQSALKSDGFVDEVLEALATAVADAHSDLRVGYDAALNGLASTAFDALTEYADGEDVTGAYPKAFVERQGSRLGKCKAALEKDAAQAAKKIAGRLKKLVKALDKRDVGLSYVIEPVRPTNDVTFNQLGVVSYLGGSSTIPAVTIDFVIAWRALDVTVGQVRAGGTGVDQMRYQQGYGVLGFGGGWVTFDVEPDESGRWFVESGAVGSNLLVKAFADSDFDFEGHARMIAIGLR